MQIGVLVPGADGRTRQGEHHRGAGPVQGGGQPSSGSGETDDRRLAAGPQHPGDLRQGLRNRGEVAEHVGGEDAVEGLVTEREELADRHHSQVDLVEGEHLRNRVDGHHLPSSEHGVGRPGPRSQVQHPAGGQFPGARPSPGLLAAQRQQPVEQVVAGRDAGEDVQRVVGHGPIESSPT